MMSELTHLASGPGPRSHDEWCAHRFPVIVLGTSGLLKANIVVSRDSPNTTRLRRGQRHRTKA